MKFGNRIRALRALVGVGVLALVAACGGNGGSAGSSGSGSTLTIANGAGTTWTCGFNPFNPSVSMLSVGFVYEPLVYVNALQNSKQTPMIAKSSKWSADGKTLTFRIRDGITWSDGKPLTADDVAYTFNLLKKNRGLDLNALWSSGMTSVTSSGNTVTMMFNTPSQTNFYYIADQTPIIPKHIWDTGTQAKNPVAFADSTPIGSGPYTMAKCTPQNVRYTARSNYWGPNKPKVQTVNYPSETNGTTLNLDLAEGKAQWGGQYIPNIKKYYVDRDKVHYHYWFPPIANVEIFPNLKTGPTSKLAVRQALALGIDRPKISSVGVSGELQPSNQAGVVTPTFNAWLDSAAVNQAGYGTPNPTKVKSLLASAGYSSSNPLKLSIISVSGYPDWEAETQEIKTELAPLGIDLTVQNIAGQTYDDKLFKGEFQLAYGSQTGGPVPYFEMRQNLYSDNTAPIGQNASTNYERFSDQKVDALFNQYPGASAQQQHQIIDQVQQVMLTQLPVIPVLESVSWYQYNTKDFTGWPTPTNAYAMPAPYAQPDLEQVLLHLQPKK
jgi:peptide/nickel transport system substrate-binding protein